MGAIGHTLFLVLWPVFLRQQINPKKSKVYPAEKLREDLVALKETVSHVGALNIGRLLFLLKYGLYKMWVNERCCIEKPLGIYHVIFIQHK